MSTKTHLLRLWRSLSLILPKPRRDARGKGGLRRVGRCSPHSPRLLHATLQPQNTHNHRDLAAGTWPWEAGHTPSIHPPHLDGLGLLQQHGHGSGTLRNEPAAAQMGSSYLLLGIHTTTCTSAKPGWVRSLQGADISASERRKRNGVVIPAGSVWGV